MSDDIRVRVRLQRDTDRETSAKAVEAAVYSAMHAAQVAGLGDIAGRLMEVWQLAHAHRREVEGGP